MNNPVKVVGDVDLDDLHPGEVQYEKDFELTLQKLEEKEQSHGKLLQEMEEYEQLAEQIDLMLYEQELRAKSKGKSEDNTTRLIDLGSGVFMRAKPVKQPVETICVDIGANVFVELTLVEAKVAVQARLVLLRKQAEVALDVRARMQAEYNWQKEMYKVLQMDFGI